MSIAVLFVRLENWNGKTWFRDMSNFVVDENANCNSITKNVTNVFLSTYLVAPNKKVIGNRF